MTNAETLTDAIHRVAVVIGQLSESMSELRKALKAVVTAGDLAFRDYLQNIEFEPPPHIDWPCMDTGMEKTVQTIQEAIETMFNNIEELPPESKETHRPPKYLGPVTKTNYSYNRPPRRARSSCYIRKR